MSLTRFDIERAFSELTAAAIPLPQQWTPTDRPKVVSRWVTDLGNITPAELDRAVAEYIRRGLDAKGVHYWPTPAKLLALIPSRPRPATLDDHWPRMDWFALRPGLEGPIVRRLPVEEGRARGLGHPWDAICPDETCQCEAKEIRVLKIAVGLPMQSRVWVWEHYAVRLPPQSFELVRDREAA